MSKKENPNLEVTKLYETSKSWDGTTLKNFQEGTPHITFMKYLIKPHTKLPTHYHIVYNFAYVIKGELTIVKTETKEEKTFKTGEAIVETLDSHHYGENRKDEDLEIVCCFVGKEGQPISIPVEEK